MHPLRKQKPNKDFVNPASGYDWLESILVAKLGLAEPELILPVQYHDRATDYSCKTPDQKIAWKLLHRNLSDCMFGKRRKRLQAIQEIYSWMHDVKLYDYPFSYWCEQLGVDDDVMRDGLGKFLTRATVAASIKDANDKAGLDGVRKRTVSRSHNVEQAGDEFVCTNCRRVATQEWFAKRACIDPERLGKKRTNAKRGDRQVDFKDAVDAIALKVGLEPLSFVDGTVPAPRAGPQRWNRENWPHEGPFQRGGDAAHRQEIILE